MGLLGHLSGDDSIFSIPEPSELNDLQKILYPKRNHKKEIMGSDLGLFWRIILDDLQSRIKADGVTDGISNSEIRVPDRESFGNLNDKKTIRGLWYQSYLSLSTTHQNFLFDLGPVKSVCPRIGQRNPNRWRNLDEYRSFMEVVSGLSQQLFPQIIDRMGYEVIPERVTIHYRLADVPFCRNMGHHIQYYAYYKWAISKLESLGYDCSKVNIITSIHHRSSKKRKALNLYYLYDFITFLKTLGVESEVYSSSIMNDFLRMTAAPALICSDSEFSFGAGLSNVGHVIFPRVFSERPGMDGIFPRMDVHFYGPKTMLAPMLPVYHSAVQNYENLNEIFSILRDEPKLVDVF